MRLPRARLVLISPVVLILVLMVGGWFRLRAWTDRRHRETLAEAKREMAAGQVESARRRLAELVERWDWGLARGFGGQDEVRGEIAYQLGIGEIRRGRKEPAEAAWQRVGRDSPFWSKAATQRAMLRIDAGQFASAEDLLKEALQRERGPDRHAAPSRLPAPLSVRGTDGGHSPADRRILARCREPGLGPDPALPPGYGTAADRIDPRRRGEIGSR